MTNEPAADRDADTRDWWWPFDPRRSLCARAILVFGGGALVFTWLASVLAGVAYRRQVEKEVGKTLETLAYQMSDKLDRTIYERYRDIQVVADLPSIRNLTEPAAERRRVLEVFKESCPDYAWIGFADMTGKVIVGTEGLPEGSQAGDRNWFRRARSMPFVGNLHRDDTLAALMPNPDGETAQFLDVSAPVRDSNAQIAGVVGAQVQWTWVRRVQSSVVTAAARKEHIGVSVYASTGECVLDSAGVGWAESPVAPSISGDRELRGSFMEIGPDGDIFLTGYARSRGFREFRGLGWLVTVRQPTADALAPVKTLQTGIRRWGAGLSVVFALWGWLYAVRLARRLRAVAASADRIRSGDILSLLPRPRGRDELRRMSVALDEMVDDFRQRQEKLETENNRLTARLRHGAPQGGGDDRSGGDKGRAPSAPPR